MSNSSYNVPIMEESRLQRSC